MNNVEIINAIIGEIKRKHKLRFNKEVAALLEMEEPTLSNILAGRKPVGKHFRKLILSEKFNVSETFLDTGKGEIFNIVLKDKSKGENITQLEKDNISFGSPQEGGREIQRSASNILMVPVVSELARAGYLAGYSQISFIEKLDKMPVVVADKEFKGNYRFFEIVGDSMNSGEPETAILEHDVAFCREVPRIYWRDKLHFTKYKAFVVLHREDGIIIKKIIKQDKEKGIITLHSLNPDPMYPDRDISLDDILEIYNVIKIQRDM